MYHRCKCRAYIEAQLQVERDAIADNSIIYSFLLNFAQIIAEALLTAASIALWLADAAHTASQVPITASARL